MHIKYLLVMNIGVEYYRFTYTDFLLIYMLVLLFLWTQPALLASPTFLE